MLLSLIKVNLSWTIFKVKPFNMNQSQETILPFSVLHDLCFKVLQKSGAPQGIANQVVDELIKNGAKKEKIAIE